MSKMVNVAGLYGESRSFYPSMVIAVEPATFYAGPAYWDKGDCVVGPIFGSRVHLQPRNGYGSPVQVLICRETVADVLKQIQGAQT